MSLEIKKESLCFSELFTKSKCEQAVSLEVNLPDYCSDIKRILKCIVTAGVSGISVSGESVTVSGSVVTRLFYVGDNDKSDCYEHTSALSCSTQIKNLPDNPLFRTATKTDYINCRALSQRKISISGSIGTLIYVYRENKKDIPCDISGMSIQCKKEKRKITNLICQTEKTFDLSETVALGNDKSDIGKIIRSDCFVRIDSKKAVADKLLIKGELCCDILYADSEKSDFGKLTHTMPLSQIIAMPGITDKSDIYLTANPSQFTVCAKNDSSGHCRLLEIASRISAVVRCCEEKEVDIIDDCYSTEYNISDEYRLTEMHRELLNEDKEIICEETVAFSDGETGKIMDMWCTDAGCSLKKNSDNAEGECTFLLCCIYEGSDGSIKYGEKNISKEVSFPISSQQENILCECIPVVTKMTYSGTSGQVGINVKLSLNCYISVCEQRRVLSDIKIDESARKKEIYPALSLYFAEKDEEIWDIARKYNTTVKLIKEENALSSDKTENETMIMIPCV